jgi:hypothetical protein
MCRDHSNPLGRSATLKFDIQCKVRLLLKEL